MKVKDQFENVDL